MSTFVQAEYVCDVCREPITGDDVDTRHTILANGEDCHEGCCPDNQETEVV